MKHNTMECAIMKHNIMKRAIPRRFILPCAPMQSATPQGFSAKRARSLLGMILCVVLASAGGRLWGAEGSQAKEDPFAAMEKNFDEQAKKMEKNFDTQTAALEKEWDRLEKEQNAAWEKMAKEIENRWRDQVLSTEKVWVDYDPDLASRSRVDFDKGKITVEVLIPADEKDPKKAGKDKIARNPLAVLGYGE